MSASVSLRGIDERVCSICTQRFWEGKVKEAPMALPCKHVFGATCLAAWLNQGHQKTCPSCRKPAFTTTDIPRQRDGDIEDAVSSLVVDEETYKDVKSALTALIIWKVQKVNEADIATKDYKLSREKLKDCVIASIGHYLNFADAEEKDKHESPYFPMLDLIQRIQIEAGDLRKAEHRAHIHEAITHALIKTRELDDLPLSKRTKLADQLMELKKPGSLFSNDDPTRAIRAIPNLHRALLKSSGFRVNCMYPLWEPNLDLLVEADLEFKGLFGPSLVSQTEENEHFNPHFAAPFIVRMLESWGITDVVVN